MPLIRLHAFVSGHVQGVFFRVSTQDEASALGLSGWVRNLRNGSVEVLAEGEEQDITNLRDIGCGLAAGAHVENVDVKKERIESVAFFVFRIIH